MNGNRKRETCTWYTPIIKPDISSVLRGNVYHFRDYTLYQCACGGKLNRYLPLITNKLKLQDLKEKGIPQGNSRRYEYLSKWCL